MTNLVYVCFNGTYDEMRKNVDDSLGKEFLSDHPYRAIKIEESGKALASIRPGDVVIVNTREVDVYSFARQLSNVDVFSDSPTRPPTPTDGSCVRGYLDTEHDDSVRDLKKSLIRNEPDSSKSRKEEPETEYTNSWGLVCGTAV